MNSWNAKHACAARLAQAWPGRTGGAPRPRRASPVGRRQATGPRRRARPGRGAGDGQPARLGLLGEGCCSDWG